MKLRILIAVIISAVVLFFFMAYRPELESKDKPERIFHDFISYKEKTKEPYGVYYVSEQFKIKSAGKFGINKSKIDESYFGVKKTNNIYAVVAPQFLPTENEVSKLMEFAELGNDVFISAFSLSPAFMNELLKLDTTSEFYNEFPVIRQYTDSIKLTWYNYNDTLNIKSELFQYPGASVYNDNLEYFDGNENGEYLSYDEENYPGLMKFKRGKGQIYVQLSPMSMTNYFLLHKQNYKYLNYIFKELDISNKTLIWDRYYRNRKAITYDGEPEEPKDSYFWELLNKKPPLKWAVFTFLAGLLLFLVNNSRRVQKPIPVIPEPSNDSALFASALAGLYWNEQEHKEIADKIILHFYDYCNKHFRITQKDFANNDIIKISQKTQKSEAEIKDILQQIASIKEQDQISKNELLSLYNKAYNFQNK